MRHRQSDSQPCRLGQRAKPRKDKQITNIGVPEGVRLK